jgi:hypothetical protein
MRHFCPQRFRRVRAQPPVPASLAPSRAPRSRPPRSARAVECCRPPTGGPVRADSGKNTLGWAAASHRRTPGRPAESARTPAPVREHWLVTVTASGSDSVKAPGIIPWHWLSTSLSSLLVFHGPGIPARYQAGPVGPFLFSHFSKMGKIFLCSKKIVHESDFHLKVAHFSIIDWLGEIFQTKCWHQQ